jgi:tetratricopeptide (TPR) repeat protein
MAVLLPALALSALLQATSPFLCSSRGGPAWRELRSEHVVLQTDLSVERARAMVRELELARGAVLQALFAKPPDIPVVLHAVAFASDGDFSDVSPEGAAAYFTTVDGFTPIVVLPGTLQSGTRAALIHELAHHISSFPLLRRPLWLNEGLAVYLESMGSVSLGAEMSVGTVPERIQVPGKRVDRVLVRDLFAWTRVDPSWGSRLVHRHYVSSWFLVHYLFNKQPRAFEDYLRRLGRAEDPRAAWKAAFPAWDPDVQGALDDLESALDTYARGTQFSYRRIDVQVSPRISEHPLPSAEVHALRAVLLSVAGERRGEVIRAEVDEALSEDPGNPRALAVLAGLDRRADLLPLARLSVQAHPTSWRAWSALASALRRDEGEERLAARRKAVDLAPDEPLAVYQLARELVAAGRAKEATPLTLQLLRVAPYSPLVHETVASVAMQLGLCVDALRSQQRAIDTLSDLAPPRARERRERVLAEYQERCSTAPPAPPSP